MPFSLDRAYVSQAEQTLNGRLPSSYVVAMCRANGGEVPAYDDFWTLHPIRDTSDRKRLSRTCNDILHETREKLEWPGFPAPAVAVASNGTGDCLLFTRRDGEADFDPTVYHWDHETGELTSVAEDFADLTT